MKRTPRNRLLSVMATSALCIFSVPSLGAGPVTYVHYNAINNLLLVTADGKSCSQQEHSGVSGAGTGALATTLMMAKADGSSVSISCAPNGIKILDIN